MFLTITEALKNDYQKYSKSAASAQEENEGKPQNTQADRFRRAGIAR